VGRCFKGLTEDSAIEVRKSFVQNFHLCYSKCTSCELKDRLFSWLLPYFSMSDREIGESLIQNRAIFQVIGTAKITAMLPQFLKVIQSLRRWRVTASAIAILTELPGETIRQFCTQICGVVHDQFAQYPAPLRQSAITFYSAVAAQTDPGDFALLLVSSFRRSPRHKLRSFFVELIQFVIPLIPVNILNEILWPNVVSLVEDPVASVRVSLLQSLQPFRKLLRQLSLIEAEQLLLGTMAILADDADPYVHAVWESHWDWISNLGMGTESTISQSMPEFAVRLPKPSHLLPSPLIVTPVADANKRKPFVAARSVRLVKTLPTDDPKAKSPVPDAGTRPPLIYGRPRARLT
jgi:hypothetical protein